jgi:hypothetical protein
MPALDIIHRARRSGTVRPSSGFSDEIDEWFPPPPMTVNDAAVTVNTLWLTMTLLLAAWVAWDKFRKCNA